MAESLQLLPKELRNKFKSITNEISTSSNKIKAKMNHVVPVVQTRMPAKLEENLCVTFRDFPVTTDYVCPRFEVDDPLAYEHLEQNGYVVFKNVISTESEIENIKNDIWTWLEELEFPKNTMIDRNDPSTWHDGNWPSDPDTGIVFGFGVGQAEFMWKCRSFPGVKRAFSTIWGTGDLITSFDGCNLYRPWKYYKGWKTKGKWWHLDQNARKKESRGKQSFQGLLALTDCDEKSGGLCVIPKTHKQHTEICERIHWPKHSDYVPIPKKDSLFDDFREIGGYLVHYKKGDFVIWDSRTVHCNSPSVEPILDPQTGKEWFSESEKKEKKWNLTRMVVYVCMTPREKAKNEILKKRKEIAFEQYATSTHWPQYFSYRLGRKTVPHKFELNGEQKRLVGYPRNMFQEIVWSAKHEFNLGFGDFFVFSSFLAAIGFAGNVFWKKRA